MEDLRRGLMEGDDDGFALGFGVPFQDGHEAEGCAGVEAGGGFLGRNGKCIFGKVSERGQLNRVLTRRSVPQIVCRHLLFKKDAICNAKYLFSLGNYPRICLP